MVLCGERLEVTPSTSEQHEASALFMNSFLTCVGLGMKVAAAFLIRMCSRLVRDFCLRLSVPSFFCKSSTAGLLETLEVVSQLTRTLRPERFLAYGTALDPRQAQITGPFLGPFLVAFSLGLISFAGAGLAPGYTGSGMNPARYFAFAVARRNFHGKCH